MRRAQVIHWKNLVKMVIVSGILHMIPFSCQKTEPVYYEMATLVTADIFFEKEGKRINFSRNTIRDIRRAFGSPSLEHRLTANEYGEVRVAYYDGFSVEYYSQSGEITYITIKSEGMNVLGGISVGDTSERVTEKLRNGIKAASGLEYIFVVMQADNKSGIGYIIKYDASAQVSEIRIGGVPFDI